MVTLFPYDLPMLTIGFTSDWKSMKYIATAEKHKPKDRKVPTYKKIIANIFTFLFVRFFNHFYKFLIRFSSV